MMEAANSLNGYKQSIKRLVSSGSAGRRVSADGGMCAIFIVVSHVIRYKALTMLFRERNDVICQLPSDYTDESFGGSILPWAVLFGEARMEDLNALARMGLLMCQCRDNKNRVCQRRAQCDITLAKEADSR